MRRLFDRNHVDGHACTLDRRYFRDNPECKSVAVAVNPDWRSPLSLQRRLGLIAGH